MRKESSMNTALEISHISYAYRSEFLLREMQVLKDVSLSIAPGEAFGFLGHNGAGKTTTLKCILDICRIRNGSISIFNEPHTDPHVRRLVGFLPEQPYFYDNLTVLETLSLYGKLCGLSGKLLTERSADLLEQFHLGQRRHSKIKSLSKGLMQRVGMAQAIIAEPQLLILDEPFSGLDPIGRKEFRELLIHLKKQGITILLSSHILSDVELICDRASVMIKGEIKGIYDLSSAVKLEEIFFNLIQASGVPHL